MVHYDGAGGLATVTMAFVAGVQWRREGWGDHNPVFKIFTKATTGLSGGFKGKRNTALIPIVLLLDLDLIYLSLFD